MVATQINGIQGAGALSQMKHFAVYNGQNQNTNTADLRPGAAPDLPDPLRGGLRQTPARPRPCAPTRSGRTPRRRCRPRSPRCSAPRRSARTPPRAEPADLAAERVALLVRAAADPDLRAARPVGLGGDGRLRLPGHAQHQCHLPGRGPGAADHHRLLQRQQQPEHQLGRRVLRASVGVRRDRRHLRRRRGQRRVLLGRRARSTWPACPGPAARPPAARWCRPWPTARCRCRCSTRRWPRCSTRSSGSACSAATRPRSRPAAPTPAGSTATRTGNAPLPTGPAHGATPTADLGTKNGDAAVVEKMSEEGAVLLKNDAGTLPITRSDLSGGGVLVTGPGAEYTIADPTGEASVGFADRDAISPLEQLKAVHRRRGGVQLRAGQLAVRRAGALLGAVRLGHLGDRAPGPHHRPGLAGRRLLDRLHHGLRQRAARARRLHLDRLRVRAGNRHLHVPLPVQQRRARRRT